MLRKIVLLLCVAFAVVCFGYPCLILPIGSYELDKPLYDSGYSGLEAVTTYQFKFNGKVERTIKLKDESNGISTTETLYYKLKGNKIIFSKEKTPTKEEEGQWIAISSIFRLGNGAFNVYACGASIGVALLAAVLIVTAPKKY